MLHTAALILLLFGQTVSEVPAPAELEALPAASEEALLPLDLDPVPPAETPAVPDANAESNAAEETPESVVPESVAPESPALEEESQKEAQPEPIPHKNEQMIPPPIRPAKESFSDPLLSAPPVNPVKEQESLPSGLEPAMDISSNTFNDPILNSSFGIQSSEENMYETNLAANQGKGHIMPIDQAEIPAQEQGVLTKFYVREGMMVEKGKPLAQIDDEQAKMSVQVQQAKLNAAEKEASNDVNIRYATAARNVADAEVKSAKETIARVPGAIPATEIRKLELAVIQATLQIEQASNQFEIAKYQVDVSKAELSAAKLGVSRRIVLAPIDGVIVEKYRNEGEWVKPGDPILKVVFLDKLRVKTTLDINKMPPQKVMNHSASVTIPQQPNTTFKGKVIFASPVVQSGGTYEVWVDVDNIVGKDGFWQLQPGMNAMVTIE